MNKPIKYVLIDYNAKGYELLQFQYPDQNLIHIYLYNFKFSHGTRI